MSRIDDFRSRLREAVERAPSRKHIYGRGAVSEGGLTKILNADVKNPRLFTIKKIADKLGTTVGALLGESGAVITDADRVELREFMTWLGARFGLKESGETRTLPKWTEEFPVEPERFIENDFDFPLELHALEVEDFEVAAGESGVNPEVDMAAYTINSTS